MRAGLISTLTAGAALAAVPAVAPAYRSVPPAGHTGGFGEPSCAACHMDPSGAATAGALVLEAPDRYEPGRKYDIRLRLTDPALAAAGFQLAVRFTDGDEVGRQAGRLAGVDSTVTVVTGEAGIRYASQTAAGAVPEAPGRATWVVRWTAPPNGRVVFHIAANAANDDDSPFDDRIHLLEHRARPR